jgi:hypothetical protein
MKNHKQITIRNETYNLLKSISSKTGLALGEIVEIAINGTNTNLPKHTTKEKAMQWHFQQIVKLAKETNKG